MTKIRESDIEDVTISLLEQQGYSYLPPEVQESERKDRFEVVFRERLKTAIDHCNPDIPEDAKECALREVLDLPSQNLLENNQAFYQMLTDGVPVEYQKDGDTVGDSVWLIDFKNPLANNFLVCNQFTIREGNSTKRLDVVLFVNGLPLVVIELKNPSDEKATVERAFRQLENYKQAIPSLFNYNGVLIASDGLDAKVGSLTAGWPRFMAWKTVDGVREDKSTTPQIETLIKGMLRPDVLLELIRHFSVFEKTRKRDAITGITSAESEKKIASYHQYYAVKKAVVSTIRATGYSSPKIPPASGQYNPPSLAQQISGDKKVGVVWHTQGSGKSLSMVFYAGKIILELGNPTIVVITDRNDLDDQLFQQFASSQQLLRQEPIQANNRVHLKKLLKTAGGGIIFTTIQKFSPEDSSETFELLSERKNIVVIADEAHRSQYGFGAKIVIKNNEAFTRYGFAKYLRDALPNASFIGFTGTPVEKEDTSTHAVFGNYIDIYDIQQAVKDGATVPIYYESRLVQVHLKPEEGQKLDAEVEQIIENEEATITEKEKAKWVQLEAIVGHRDRTKTIAQDILDHFEKRQEAFEGKAMIVCMSRRIAVGLYDEIMKLRPQWRNLDKRKEVIKVIMTSSASDPQNWQIHNTTKEDRKELSDRFKNSGDALKLVIVRDMWLTGFDAPCLHTMYIDKTMRGHNLMQAIARVNRVYKDKPGGLIVDYIGIASNLKQALLTYTESEGRGTPTLDQSEAIVAMVERYEIIVQMFHKFDYKKYFSVDTKEKMSLILEAQEHILKLEDGKNRFIKQTSMLAKAFVLSVPSVEAMGIKEELGFFQAIQARLTKFEFSGNGKSNIEIETAIRQLVDKALVADGVIDIFDAAGIKKPNISILSNEFLEEVRGMKQKNLALELLKKLLNDEIKTKARKNIIQSRKLSELLSAVIKKYQNNLLTATEVVDELLNFAKEIRASDERGEDLGLSEEEVAFYDALAANDSAKQVLGDDILRQLAQILVKEVKATVTIDWTIKKNVQAKLRVMVKKILDKYGYPPDEQKLATENILKQTELFANERTS